MQTTAIRLYGANDLRMETFSLPPLKETEVLLEIVTDSLCASTYKAVRQGTAHKRVPPDIAEHPVLVGHEMCGKIVEIGAKVQGNWTIGQKVVIQPALKLESGYDPGYSYPYIGGSATYVIVPEIVLSRNCMIPFAGDSYFKGSLVESLGCVLRGYKGFYHTDAETYRRTDGAKRGGKLAVLGGAGPMGIGAVELAIGYAGVSQVVVTDLNEARLTYAQEKCPVDAANANGVSLHYVNTANEPDAVATLRALSDGGFDDVFVMVPVPELFTMAEAICREDGCVNFFAGPAVHNLQGSLNLYRVHYDGIHVVGTAGSIPEDTTDIIQLIERNKIHPGALVSHILGLRAAVDAIFAMEHPSGAKKVCYPALDLPLIALSDLPILGKTDPLYAALAELVAKNGGLWCKEAEDYLLAHAPRICEKETR